MPNRNGLVMFDFSCGFHGCPLYLVDRCKFGLRRGGTVSACCLKLAASKMGRNLLKLRNENENNKKFFYVFDFNCLDSDRMVSWSCRTTTRSGTSVDDKWDSSAIHHIVRSRSIKLTKQNCSVSVYNLSQFTHGCRDTRRACNLTLCVSSPSYHLLPLRASSNPFNL